ncbi:MAG: peptidylprolyl isomerase [Verrucomicrobiae bacterium]|nr:peptidylprolyl isomerase [Verrucomicrobiae bacterium]
MRYFPIRSILLRLTVVFLGACGLPFAGAQSDPGKVLVKVNGEAITQADVDEVFNGLVGDKAKTASAASLAKVRAENEPLIIEQLIDKKLLMKMADDQEVSAAEVERAVQEVKKALTPAEFKQMNWTDEKLRREISNDLKINKLIEARAASMPGLTDDEMKAYYNANIGEFATPRYVKPRHILIATDGATGDALREKRLQAERIRLKLNAAKGANFSEMAKQHSTCPSAKNGGVLEKVFEGQMPKEFEAVAFTQPIGEVSSVFETDLGFHILIVDERQEATTLSLQQAAPRIAQILMAQRKQTAMDGYLKDLKSKAKIQRL